MLLVKTHIGNSKISGTGLFSSEFIPKGTPIWMLNESDIKYSYNEVNKMTDLQKEFILKYAYTEKQKYILCIDDARFMNHSFVPNIHSIGEFEVAKTDIKIGEEITCNYFDINDDLSRPIFKELKKLHKL